MLAVTKQSRVMMMVMITLLTMTIGVLDLAQAQGDDWDLDGAGIVGPKPGSGPGGPPGNGSLGPNAGNHSSSNNSNVGIIVYADKDLPVQPIPLTEDPPGLKISRENKDLVLKKVASPENPLQWYVPYPKVALLSNASGFAHLFKNSEKIVVQGEFRLLSLKKDLLKGKVDMGLIGDSQTVSAVTCICVGGNEELKAEELKDKIAQGSIGSYETLMSTGNLDLSSILQNVFGLDSNLLQVGILHVEYDDASNVLKETALVLKRKSVSARRVEIEVAGN